ncbi:protein kinase domain-containing protein [Kitasatospora sp. NPDC054939]
MAGRQRGDRVGDRYRLDAVLGAGGFGRVWQAYDTALHIDVAVKELHLPPTVSPAERTERLRRAEREARSAARLRDHPNIVTVHDVVVEDGVPWIVMQLVRGVSLSDLIRRGPVPVDTAVGIAAALLKALDTAHRAGIVHRDVKPGNVMVSGDGEVLLTDFGIAARPSANTLTLTADGMVIGSVEYMAPERARGDRGDARSDLFSLGVTLYHAVEGVSPFQRDNPFAALHAVAYEEAPAPVRAGRLGPVVTRLMAKDPAARPDVAEAQRLLEPPQPPPHREAERQRPPGQDGNRAQQQSPRERTPQVRPSGPNRAARVLAALLAVAVTAGFYAGNRGFSEFVTEELHLRGTAWTAARGDCLHRDADGGSAGGWAQVPCFAASADHTVLVAASGDTDRCGASGAGEGGTVIRESTRSGARTLCVKPRRGAAAAGTSPSTPTAPTTPPRTSPAQSPTGRSTPPGTPSPRPAPATERPTATGTPAFDPESLDSATTDRTPLTADALLASSFVDGKGVRYKRTASGVHPCVDTGMKESLRSVLRKSGCGDMVTGVYLDESERIMVVLWVLPLPDLASAKSLYSSLDGVYDDDWGVRCPKSGAGSQVCDAGRDTDRATKSGFIRRTHRYVLHSLAVYVSLTQSQDVEPWVKAAADSAVDSAGPANHQR